jgi:DNA-binding CsgD family transcriptional regulator
MRDADQHLDDLERGRACYGRRAWAEAYDALARADEVTPLGADDLELYAWSAALNGHDEELLGVLERLYNARADAGEYIAAAHMAFWLGFRLVGLGEMGRASGWLTRAQRLVENEGRECVVRGYLLLPLVHRYLHGGDYDAAHAAAVEAIEIGEGCGDRDLAAFARNLQGRVLIRQGRVEDGLALLDEAMLAVTAGELSPLITGFIYCNVISCCQQVYALNRAREWTSALADWCQTQPQLVTFTGACLVHRSEIMQLGGDWAEAIEEARRASARFTRPMDHEVAADAFYQQAEIHRLRGEFVEAEDAYRQANQLGREPQPGLALLRLAQERRDAAASAIRRVVGATADRLQRTRLLPAYVEITLALGEIDEARVVCQELDEIAEGLGTEVVGAMAAHARGAIQLAEGDAQAAAEQLRRAFHVWQKLGAPYLAARIRVLLGSACHVLGDEDGALLELDAAREVFERLGAVPDVARVDALVKKPKTGRPHGLTPRELEVLRLVASGKTNKAIAKELSLSEKTVDRHVSNIFVKVNVASRAAATAYAYEHDLI